MGKHSLGVRISYVIPLLPTAGSLPIEKHTNRTSVADDLNAVRPSTAFVVRDLFLHRFSVWLNRYTAIPYLLPRRCDFVLLIADFPR